MTCGCRIKVDHLNPENYFVAELLRCPLHEAAGEMLKALEPLAYEADGRPRVDDSELIPVPMKYLRVARAACRKAKNHE